MPLTIGVPKETADGETRVALVPDVVRRLTGADLNVVVEKGAGAGAHHSDEDYRDAGASVGSRAEALGAQVVAVVAPPPDEEVRQMKRGQVLVGLLDPLGRPEGVRTLAEAGVTALSMEKVPRISRAQKMDALSAMSSLAGYRAALIGAHALPKFFPLLTTAAGTIRPAQVLVLGAGVAGLQAIATARRLGAKVSGYDIRAATREEVESLGAAFVDLEADIEGEGEGGYAKELDADVQERQPELLKPHVAEADVVISTALIPGRPAPILVSEEAVAAMAPGSVVVDLAAPGGGNCALTEAGQTVEADGGQRVFGPTNLPAEMPVHASQLYARTIAALVQDFVSDDGSFTPDFDDEVFAGACVAHGGEVREEGKTDEKPPAEAATETATETDEKTDAERLASDTESRAEDDDNRENDNRENDDRGGEHREETGAVSGPSDGAEGGVGDDADGYSGNGDAKRSDESGAESDREDGDQWKPPAN